MSFRHTRTSQRYLRTPVIRYSWCCAMPGMPLRPYAPSPFGSVALRAEAALRTEVAPLAPPPLSPGVAPSAPSSLSPGVMDLPAEPPALPPAVRIPSPLQSGYEQVSPSFRSSRSKVLLMMARVGVTNNLKTSRIWRALRLLYRLGCCRLRIASPGRIRLWSIWNERPGVRRDTFRTGVPCTTSFLRATKTV